MAMIKEGNKLNIVRGTKQQIEDNESYIPNNSLILITDEEFTVDEIVGLDEALDLKINKNDIVNNLITDDITKVLSAAQGKALSVEQTALKIGKADRTQVANDLALKVDKETGKGLSTNDYTTDEKTKLENIESGAQVNDIEVIKVNGVPQTITNKEVNIVVSDSGSGSGDVNSVNGKTGVVVLSQDDIGDGTTYKRFSQTEKTKLDDMPTPSTIVVDDDLAIVATSGSYNDLTNKPSAYTLPKATNTVLGGVKAKAKTTETNEVAIDNDGKLWANSGGGGGSATIPVVRMDKITNTIDLSSFDIPFPVYQLDIEPNKKYVIKSQPGAEGTDGVYVIFTPTGLDYTDDGSSVEYNDTEYKEFTIDIYFEKEATINFVDFTGPVILYTKVNANVDYTVNEFFFLSIVLPGETLYTISMVDGNVLIYGWK